MTHVDCRRPVRRLWVAPSDETPLVDPNSKKAKEIAGKSPMRIALDRLRKDKIAVVCAVVVFFFILIAIFAGVIADFFGVSPETPFAAEVLDMLNRPPEGGPAVARLRPRPPVRHRAAHRRGQPGPLALRLPDLADHRRQRDPVRRHRSASSSAWSPASCGGDRRQDPLLHHRPVPDDPVPAGGAGPGPDHQRAVLDQPELLRRSSAGRSSPCSRSSAGWASPA